MELFDGLCLRKAQVTALPVAEAERDTPETTPSLEGKEIHRGIRDIGKHSG